MNSDAFQALIGLVNFDQKTASFLKEIKKIKSDIVVLQKEKDDLQDDMENAKNILHDTQKEVDMGELEMKEYDQKVQEEKERLDKVTNQKEYSSILKEIETLETKQHEAEDPLLLAWNKLEQVKQEFKKKEQEFDKKIVEIDQQVKDKNKKIEELENQLSEHNTLRDEKLKIVPEEWLEKYDMLGARVSDPVVPVETGICSACFYKVTSQNMIEMKKGKLIQCKGCYRFLYIKKEKE